MDEESSYKGTGTALGGGPSNIGGGAPRRGVQTLAGLGMKAGETLDDLLAPYANHGPGPDDDEADKVSDLFDSGTRC